MIRSHIRGLAAALLALAAVGEETRADPTDIESFGTATLAGSDLRAQALVALPDGRYAVVGLAPSRVNSAAAPSVAVAIFLSTLQLDRTIGTNTPGVVVINQDMLMGDRPEEEFDRGDFFLGDGTAEYHERGGLPGIVVALSLQSRNRTTSATTDFLFVLRVSLAGPSAGALDPGFGNGGMVRSERIGIVGAMRMRALDVTPSQQIYALISRAGGTSAPAFDIMRLREDGSIDLSWGAMGTVTSVSPLGTPAFRVEAQSDGGALIAGARWISNRRDLVVSRVDALGAALPSFGTVGTRIVSRGNGGTLELHDWAVDPVGRRLLLGSGPSGHAHVSRLSADGDFDALFDAAFNATTGSDGGVDGFLAIFEGAPCAVRVQLDGRVIVASALNGAIVRVGRLLADASNLDPQFRLGEGSDLPEFADIAPPVPDTSISNCAGAHLRPDGRIVLAGTLRPDDMAGESQRGLDSFALIQLEGGNLPPRNTVGALSFSQGSTDRAENAGSIALQVVRTGGSTGAVSVDYRTVPLTATEGADYAPVSGTLAFADGETEAVIVVPIVNDAVFEPTVEEFQVELSNPTNGATVSAPGTAVVRILDDDGRFDLELKVERFAYENASNGPARYRLIYDFTVTNLGVAPSPERTVSLTNFPEQLLDLESVEIRDSFSSFDNNLLRWSLPSLMLNQAARVRLVTTCTILNGTGALVNLGAQIDANVDDINPGNDVAAVRSPCGGDDLAVAASSTKLIYGATEPVVWNVRVSRVDLGPDPVHARDVTLTVSLNARGVSPTQLSLISFLVERTTGATCVAQQMNRFLICPLGDFAPGRALPIDLRFEAYGLDGNPLSIAVELYADVFDPDAGNNSADSEVTINTGSYNPLIRGGFEPDDDCGSGFCCFIATAAYGSWLDPHVVSLRAFRDRWLLTHAPGRAFVAWYYRVSPPAADWIREREWARTAARATLAPIVFVITSPIESALIVLSFAFAAILGVHPRRRAAIARAHPDRG